jgi:hypothetical protein
MSSVGRRAFLRGLGGFTLALPFLPSICSPRDAKGGPMAGNKLFCAFATHHGGIWQANLWPSDSTLTDKKTYAGHEIRRGDLVATTSGSNTVLSPVLTAPSADLTPALVAKMNLVRGVDVPFYIGHHTGGHLGNYARNDGNGTDGKVVQEMPRPTIDQVMAWSPSFYPDLSSIKERALVAGRRVSYNWSNPSAKTGTIDEQASEDSSLALFNKIFVPTGDPTRKPIVDRVLEDYKRLRNGSRRLSNADRARLDDHMQRLSELQRRLNAKASCGDVPKPTEDSQTVRGKMGFDFDPALQAHAYDLLNDVIVAAFLCGTSRIAVINGEQTFSNFTGDWHQDIAHKAHLPDGAQQKTIADAHQSFFAGVFVDLIKKLDIDDGTGMTLLDRSLVQWTHESGPYTHESVTMPVITAGSAGGAIKTGNYCDYRNLGNFFDKGGFQGATEVTNAGLVYNQWLGTVLQSMGLARKDFETDGNGGYGVKYIGDGRAKFYPDSVFSVSGEMLPFLV